jgi:hypothetical protein
MRRPAVTHRWMTALIRRPGARASLGGVRPRRLTSSSCSKDSCCMRLLQTCIAWGYSPGGRPGSHTRAAACAYNPVHGHPSQGKDSTRRTACPARLLHTLSLTGHDRSAQQHCALRRLSFYCEGFLGSDGEWGEKGEEVDFEAKSRTETKKACNSHTPT